ncbi:hypothetical protein BH09MYX1_BH09MYX1_28340 [soil metagenome]
MFALFISKPLKNDAVSSRSDSHFDRDCLKKAYNDEPPGGKRQALPTLCHVAGLGRQENKANAECPVEHGRPVNRIPRGGRELNLRPSVSGVDRVTAEIRACE